jgi:hypothetical protein
MLSTSASPTVQEAIFTHLVAAGMIPDRNLLVVIDTAGVTTENGVVVVPDNFATKLRARKPHLFVEERAVFDARKATAAEADARFREIERRHRGQRASAATARTMAELRAGR